MKKISLVVALVVTAFAFASTGYTQGCTICPVCGTAGLIGPMIGATFHYKCTMGHIWPCNGQSSQPLQQKPDCTKCPVCGDGGLIAGFRGAVMHYKCVMGHVWPCN